MAPNAGARQALAPTPGPRPAPARARRRRSSGRGGRGSDARWRTSRAGDQFLISTPPMNAMPRRITRWLGSAGACVLSTTPPRMRPRLDLDDPAGRDADVDAAPHREDLDRDRVGRRHRVAQVDVAAAHDGGHLDVRDRAAGPPIRAPEDREDPDDLAADSGRGRGGGRRPRRRCPAPARAPGRPREPRRERRRRPPARTPAARRAEAAAGPDPASPASAPPGGGGAGRRSP